MATIPYIIEAINEKTSKILSIGLGGANINNFFSEPPNKHNITVVEIDAAMKEVAQKWFGLEENGRHQVLVDDGVEFLRKLAENEKFDIIFIDACHSKREDNEKVFKNILNRS
uniref:PABS domain-containing protein n=2 Tax=Acrobeloides nanus TaxID=290746 RepID=A0A914DN67_9BILA